MDPSILAAMDKEALKKQIENMKYQASMERWPLSKSIAAWVILYLKIVNFNIVSDAMMCSARERESPYVCARDNSAFNNGSKV